MADARRPANPAKLKLNACFSSLTSQARSMDSFSQSFKMKLENGQTSMGSLLGFCLTIVTALAVMGFAYTKAQILFERKEVDVITSVAKDFF